MLLLASRMMSIVNCCTIIVAVLPVVAGFLTTRIQRAPTFPQQCYYYNHATIHPSITATTTRTRIRQSSSSSSTPSATTTLIREELLEGEYALLQRSETPITTLTWFQGDSTKAATALQDRLPKIMDHNPWLGGRITSDQGKAILTFDPTTPVHMDRHFRILSPHQSPIRRQTPLPRLARDCKDLLLKNGSTEPLFQVTMVPCRTRPTTHFALIVALSHIVGDGHTYYKLLSMLCSKDADGNDATIKPLIYQRIASSTQQQADAMGQDNYDFFARPGPAFFLNYAAGVIKARTFGAVNQCIFARVDEAGMQQEKKKYSDTTEAVDFVSTNDVLTSWFLKTTQSDVGAMAINFRNRLKGHTDHHAGNYESIIVYAPRDYDSPALIRKSLDQFRRTETIHDPLPNFFQALGLSSGLVTNWSSFSQPNNNLPSCREELHIPLYDAVPLVPSGTAVMIIFRAGPTQGLGLFLAGSPTVLNELGYSRQFQMKKPAFLSSRPLR